MSTLSLSHTGLSRWYDPNWCSGPDGESRRTGRPFLLVAAARGFVSGLSGPISEWVGYRSGVTSASSTMASELDVDLVFSIFVPREFIRIERFLRDNPELVSLLLESVDAIDRVFGAESTVELELVSDPDGFGKNELYAFIRTDLDADDAYRQLQEFDALWWIDALPRGNCNLTFSLAFDDV